MKIAVVIIAMAIILLIFRPIGFSVTHWIGYFCIIAEVALGVYAFAREFADKEIVNYIQHPEEYQIDTISVNGVDHYEVKKL